jgi:nucleotide-binding universal stress UspA family protein
MVVGYEATREGRDAVRLASLLGPVFDARPVVATVLPLPRRLIPQRRLTDALEAPPFGLFDLPRSELGGQVKDGVIADSSPARGLCRLARSEAAGLIVVGASHRSPLGRALLGSVGESLVREAPVPVAVAPRGYSRGELALPLKVGVAFDGSREADHALHAGIELAAAWQSSLVVVTVGRGLPQERFERALGRITPALDVEVVRTVGQPASALARLSGRLDLLVAGARSRGVIRRMAFGSVTRRLITSSSCPLLVVPGGSSLEGLATGDPISVVTTDPAQSSPPMDSASAGESVSP